MTERSAPVARLLQQLAALDRAYSPGHHGRWSASRRAAFVDACLRELFEAADPLPRASLVAVGGYGRGELLPASDVDLLLLHEGEGASAVGALAERLLYPLWDAGVSVGHGVRSPAESLELAAESLEAATAMLDGRLVAGEPEVWLGLHASLRDALATDVRAFAERLRADGLARRARFGSASSLLEPNLKDGVGGLRDVAVLRWIGAVADPGLEQAGLIRGWEREAMDEAAEFLVRVRSALHLQTGRATDRLLLEQQAQVAREMGFADEPGLLAVDGLMRQVFEHARIVEHVIASVFDRLLREPSVAVVVEASPEGILRAFAAVAREGGVMPVWALEDIGRVDIPSPVTWSDEVRDAFLELLRTGDVPAFETLDRLGFLVRYLPAWADVRARPQRDPYHRSPVDAHLLDAFGEMARLLADPGEDPVAARALEAVTDRDGVLLGALLHDIGKIGRGNHVPEGARIAAQTLDAMGVPATTRGLALFLVAEHLLLSDTATRRDLEDQALIHDTAARIAEPERLASLYLLTLADAAATGPLAWTPWRATLVRELVAKVQRVFERGEVGIDTAGRLAERLEAIGEGVPDAEPEAIERLLRRMPHGYVLTAPVERVARELPLIEQMPGSAEIRTLETPGSRPGTYELTVVAADRPGLLSMIAGALSLAGLSILSAQVFTSEDGLAVDRFEVEGAFETEIGRGRWREFRSSLRRAIEGRLSLTHLVGEKRAHYPASRHHVPVRVEVDNEASDFFTVIEVGAPDRVGLLFDITRTFAEQGLDVHLAKVATYGDRVVDAFYVRDGLGRRLEDPGLIAELERALVSRLEA